MGEEVENCRAREESLVLAVLEAILGTARREKSVKAFMERAKERLERANIYFTERGCKYDKRGSDVLSGQFE